MNTCTAPNDVQTFAHHVPHTKENHVQTKSAPIPHIFNSRKRKMMCVQQELYHYHPKPKSNKIDVPNSKNVIRHLNHSILKHRDIEYSDTPSQILPTFKISVNTIQT